MLYTNGTLNCKHVLLNVVCVFECSRQLCVIFLVFVFTHFGLQDSKIKISKIPKFKNSKRIFPYNMQNQKVKYIKRIDKIGHISDMLLSH